eukprot:89228-Pyramimonas_sp.AAC.2
MTECTSFVGVSLSRAPCSGNSSPRAARRGPAGTSPSRSARRPRACRTSGPREGHRIEPPARWAPSR